MKQEKNIVRFLIPGGTPASIRWGIDLIEEYLPETIPFVYHDMREQPHIFYLPKATFIKCFVTVSQHGFVATFPEIEKIVLNTLAKDGYKVGEECKRYYPCEPGENF